MVDNSHKVSLSIILVIMLSFVVSGCGCSDENLTEEQKRERSACSFMEGLHIGSERSEKPVPYKTVYQDDDAMPLGEERVVQEGVEGKKEVYIEWCAKDGKNYEKDLSKVVREPVDEIIARGTFVAAVAPPPPAQPQPAPAPSSGNDDGYHDSGGSNHSCSCYDDRYYEECAGYYSQYCSDVAG